MSLDSESRLKLMVVDDEPDNLDLLYRTFRRDFHVFMAESAIDALEVLEQQGEMAIIISDQRMPEMLGTEFLSKTVERFPDTIRIVLTGYTDVEDLVEAINSGKVFKYITKPWNTTQVKGVIQQAAETYRVIKQRTHDLRRALRRESLFNAVTTALRESIDYRSMLQTIAETLGKTFNASHCVLYPVQGDRLADEAFAYTAHPIPGGKSTGQIASPTGDAIVQATLQDGQLHHTLSSDRTPARLVVPLTYQQDFLAILSLSQNGPSSGWSTEDIELLQGVAEQSALAISQAKLYQRTQKQAEQMRAELAVARQIQTNLLRQHWPDLDGIRIQACCYPAREVGGDFFEVYVHPQGDVWLAVGDVSGKGVPAALFMASAISVLRRELSQEDPPEPNVVMQNLNHSLLDDLVSTNCFITMILARYSPDTRELVYANAGHIYPLVWSAQAPTPPAAKPDYLTVRGIPLGILPQWKATSGSRSLQSGEVLILTSDGLTEVTLANPIHLQEAPLGPMLQQDGLWELLKQEPSPLNLEHFLSQVRSQATIQEDDQTILSLEIL